MWTNCLLFLVGYELMGLWFYQELQARIDGLLHVVSTQHSKIDKMNKVIRLKDMWKKLIIPHCDADNEGMEH